MSPRLGVLLIHGMGSQEPGFAEETVAALTRELRERGHAPGDVAWQEIFWADVLGPRERQYLDRAREQVDLDYVKLRKFVVNALGDAVAYQWVASAANTTYARVHERVARGVQELYTKGLGSKPAPLVILAHSLGGHVVSNYVWDMQHGKLPAITGDFERMELLAGLVTFGCNLPLFSFAYDPVEPIRFPGAKLDPVLAARARWLNFFDPDDILGYPLRAINERYRAVVHQDIPISAGSLFSSWNPLSHAGYWTDDDFLQPVAKFLATLL